MFHALVAVKQVPDTTNIRIDPETGNLVREGVPAIMNPYDAHALAAAVEWKHKLNGRVTVVSMGPPSFTVTIREAIEMGADRGILVSSRKLAGADTLATSYVLAEVIKAIHAEDPIDLIFFGKQAIDGDTAQVGPGVAVRMDLPIVTYAVNIRAVDLDDAADVPKIGADRIVLIFLPGAEGMRRLGNTHIADPSVGSSPAVVEHEVAVRPLLEDGRAGDVNIFPR